MCGFFCARMHCNYGHMCAMVTYETIARMCTSLDCIVQSGKFFLGFVAGKTHQIRRMTGEWQPRDSPDNLPYCTYVQMWCGRSAGLQEGITWIFTTCTNRFEFKPYWAPAQFSPPNSIWTLTESFFSRCASARIMGGISNAVNLCALTGGRPQSVFPIWERVVRWQPKKIIGEKWGKRVNISALGGIVGDILTITSLERHYTCGWWENTTSEWGF